MTDYSDGFHVGRPTDTPGEFETVRPAEPVVGLSHDWGDGGKGRYDNIAPGNSSAAPESQMPHGSAMERIAEIESWMRASQSSDDWAKYHKDEAVQAEYRALLETDGPGAAIDDAPPDRDLPSSIEAYRLDALHSVITSQEDRAVADFFLPTFHALGIGQDRLTRIAQWASSRPGFTPDQFTDFAIDKEGLSDKQIIGLLQAYREGEQIFGKPQT